VFYVDLKSWFYLTNTAPSSSKKILAGFLVNLLWRLSQPFIALLWISSVIHDFRNFVSATAPYFSHAWKSPLVCRSSTFSHVSLIKVSNLIHDGWSIHSTWHHTMWHHQTYNECVIIVVLVKLFSMYMHVICDKCVISHTNPSVLCDAMLYDIPITVSYK